MAKTHKVVWSEGLFLNPHHFQQADRYYEQTLLQRTNCLLPVSWGISEISIEEDTIQNGILTLHSLKGIMPDGTLMDIGDSDPLPESRSFQEVFSPAIDSLNIYIALPLHKTDNIVCNLSGKNDVFSARYNQEYVNVTDENTGSNEQTLSVARKNIKIIFEGEPLDGFTSIKIAKIDRTAEGYVLDENYIPPLLNITASKFLMKIIRRALESLSARSTELSNMRRQRSAEMSDFNPSDISNFLFLQTINLSIPIINHFYYNKKGNPEQLYLAFVQLLGQLMTFSTEGHPRDLPPYEHTNLTNTFNKLDEKVESLLGTVISSKKFVSIPLERKSENLFVGNITDEKLFVGSKFFLAVEGKETPQADIIKYVPYKLKLSSADVISEIINAAMPGIGLSHISVPPSSLPVRVGYEYFLIETSGELWNQVKESQKLAVYVPKDLSDIDIKLIVIRA